MILAIVSGIVVEAVAAGVIIGASVKDGKAELE